MVNERNRIPPLTSILSRQRRARRLLGAARKIITREKIFGLGLVLALSVGQLNAQQQPPKIIYLYDDLARLIRVIDVMSNECATYEYDAAQPLNKTKMERENVSKRFVELLKGEHC
jgi:hypothetical protein